MGFIRVFAAHDSEGALSWSASEMFVAEHHASPMNYGRAMLRQGAELIAWSNSQHDLLWSTDQLWLDEMAAAIIAGQTFAGWSKAIELLPPPMYEKLLPAIGGKPQQPIVTKKQTEVEPFWWHHRKINAEGAWRATLIAAGDPRGRE